MATVNIFNDGQVKQFFLTPQYWKCNCGKPVYTHKKSMSSAFSTITCQCGHELSKTDYDAFVISYYASLTEDLKIDQPDIPIGKKYDVAKIRMDLLLDMPRALKAIAELMQLALKDYEEGSWLTVPNGQKRYRAAHLRHTFERPINHIDPQFGLDHDVAIALNAMFVLELRLREEEGVK